MRFFKSFSPAFAVFCLALVLGSVSAEAAPGYRYARSTGPFFIPTEAVSVDWVVVNNSDRPQTFRMTVYRLAIGAPKQMLAPGALELTLGPGESTHNANSVGTVFQLGFAHEMVIESDSLDVLPMAVSWSAFVAYPVNGSTIVANDWVLLGRR